MDAFRWLPELASDQKKSPPTSPKDETSDFSELGYDPQEDFLKFLEEARRHVNETKNKSHTMEMPVFKEDKKNKNWWKKLLLLWGKCNKKKNRKKKSTTSMESTSDRESMVAAPAPAPKQKPVSGPVLGGRGKMGSGRFLRCASGPLSDCFTPKLANTGMSYITLEQHYTPSRIHTFGPIYQVT